MGGDSRLRTVHLAWLRPSPSAERTWHAGGRRYHGKQRAGRPSSGTPNPVVPWEAPHAKSSRAAALLGARVRANRPSTCRPARRFVIQSRRGRWKERSHETTRHRLAVLAPARTLVHRRPRRAAKRLKLSRRAGRQRRRNSRKSSPATTTRPRPRHARARQSRAVRAIREAKRHRCRNGLRGREGSTRRCRRGNGPSRRPSENAPRRNAGSNGAFR